MNRLLDFALGRFGFYWGLVGIIILLMFAIFRLSLKVVEMSAYPLGLVHWFSLIVFAFYMSYAEGYKGFHRNFSPRVVARAGHLLEHPDPWLILLAPLFCMGYFHATRKRKITSYVLTSAILILVITVGMLPQPWRGIIDVGVVVGLLVGVASILFFWIQLSVRGISPAIPADIPSAN